MLLGDDRAQSSGEVKSEVEVEDEKIKNETVDQFGRHIDNVTTSVKEKDKPD